ncbi:hypothetical protein OG497_37830 [Streptomyces sp. NBC_01242]|uniref:hypothetical protein n=1 Tax=Streptomyces sp. NBC_01242 TaxID=2903795 RepID=UPI002250A68E|nr:hypothetical protein [Streptomyces sp. NBC_01242]MCX4799619.1 hypothetical protein [Streptomyces sp. NBC_01242]
MDTATRTRRVLGKIVAIPATGEWARARLAYTSGEHAGMIEIGMADGTTRMATAADILPITDPPKDTRAIPVFPDAADGSSRPMGTCENEGCGITANVISIVAEKGAQWHCGAHMVKDRNARSGWRRAKTRIVCTHCYAATGS